MADSMSGKEALVVSTNHGDYFVIPAEVLPRFRASEEQRRRMDEEAGALAAGSFIQLRADEASAKPSYASLVRTTAIAWFENK